MSPPPQRSGAARLFEVDAWSIPPRPIVPHPRPPPPDLPPSASTRVFRLPRSPASASPDLRLPRTDALSTGLTPIAEAPGLSAGSQSPGTRPLTSSKDPWPHPIAARPTTLRSCTHVNRPLPVRALGGALLSAPAKASRDWMPCGWPWPRGCSAAVSPGRDTGHRGGSPGVGSTPTDCRCPADDYRLALARVRARRSLGDVGAVSRYWSSCLYG